MRSQREDPTDCHAADAADEAYQRNALSSVSQTTSTDNRPPGDAPRKALLCAGATKRAARCGVLTLAEVGRVRSASTGTAITMTAATATAR